MHPRSFIVGTSALVLAALRTLAASEPAQEFGGSVIERLRDARTRLRAMSELEAATSTFEPEQKPFIAFGIQDPRLTRCPSPQGVLWLASFIDDYDAMLRAMDQAPDRYPLLPDDPANSESMPSAEFHQPGDKDGLWLPPAAPLEGRVLIFLDGQGKVVCPFDGDNVCDGWIVDLNQDGILERIDSTNCRLSADGEAKMTTSSVWIATVEPKPRTLFHVLYNRHPQDADADSNWSWQLRDLDGDHRLEVCLGPKIRDTVDPKAVYRWNGGTQTFEGPTGGRGQHFLRQSDLALRSWDWLEQVAKDGGLNYPLHQCPRTDVAKEPPPPKVGYSSPFMPECTLPDELWSLIPREAALRLVEANRTAEHRARFALDIAPEAKSAPETGIVQSSTANWADYAPQNLSYGRCEWLRINAKDAAMLALPEPVWGVPLGKLAEDVPLERARWILQTLWWLDQLRTRQTALSSTAADEDLTGCDGVDMCDRYALWITPGDGRPAVVHPVEFLRSLDSGWRGPFTRLIAHKLSACLWEAWLGREAKPCLQDVRPSSIVLPSIEDAEPGSPLFPALWIRAMVWEAGHLGIQEAKGPLEKLLAKLPPPSKIEQEWLRCQSRNSSGLSRVMNTRRLERAVFQEPGFQLRESISRSIRKIVAFHNEVILRRMATTDVEVEPLREWAKYRLSIELDPARQIPAGFGTMPAKEKLETLLKRSRWEDAIAFFDTLTDAERRKLIVSLCEALPLDHDWPATARNDLWYRVVHSGEFGPEIRVRDQAGDLIGTAESRMLRNERSNGAAKVVRQLMTDPLSAKE